MAGSNDRPPKNCPFDTEQCAVRFSNIEHEQVRLGESLDAIKDTLPNPIERKAEKDILWKIHENTTAIRTRLEVVNQRSDDALETSYEVRRELEAEKKRTDRMFNELKKDGSR